MTILDDVPREKLRQLIDRHGYALCDDPQRTRSLLSDVAGEYRREIKLIADAQVESVPKDLLDSTGTPAPPEMLFARLEKRLCDNLSITTDAARWAVETWAMALGVQAPIRTTPAVRSVSPAAASPLAASASPSGPIAMPSSFNSTPPPVSDHPSFRVGPWLWALAALGAVVLGGKQLLSSGPGTTPPVTSIPATAAKPAASAAASKPSASASASAAAKPAASTAQPSETSVTTGLAVAQAYAGNGLSLKLDKVDARANDLNTHFFVTNRGGADITFNTGPQEGYFVLTDNTGRAWPPIEMSKDKVSLKPGQTSGDIGPRFDGRYLTDARVNSLSLTVQGLASVPKLEWTIPINSTSASSNDTGTDKVLPVGQTWNFHDLAFKLEKTDINQNDVNTRLRVTNGTKNPMVFEIDPKVSNAYVALKDNVGRSWPVVDGYKGRVALNPGSTSDDLGPRFDGKLLTDPQTSTLTVTVRGVLGLPNAQWSFPVNSRPAPPSRPDTEAGTVLTVGQPWRTNDLILRLDRVDLSSSSLNTKFFVTNDTQAPLVFEFGSKLGFFQLVDSKGRSWPMTDVPSGRASLQPGKTSGDLGARFDGKLLSDKDVSFVTLIVKGLVGVSEAKWKIDIPH